MNSDLIKFTERVAAVKKACCLSLFSQNRRSFQIKKEKTITKNLERIFNAALKLSNKKGFHAMSMRDLSREADMSSGALYNYFKSKEELLHMMQEHRRMVARQILTSDISSEKKPAAKLKIAIRTHLYLSEIMQPWFYFSYMEAKNLDADERQAAVQSELNTERQFAEILEAGMDGGVFQIEDCRLTASLIKAVIQDWYLKRSKYERRGISVDDYARFITAFLEKNLGLRGQS